MSKVTKSIDQKLFSLTDQFKSSSTFQQLMSPLDSLPSDMQTIVNRLLAFAIPMIPAVIFIVVLSINLNMRSDLQTKAQLVTLVKKIDQQKAKQRQFEISHVINENLSSKPLLETKLKSMASAASILNTAVTINEYEQNKIGALGQSLAKVNFKGVSTSQLSSLLKQIVANSKMKIKGIDIKKVNKTLQGSLHIIYFSRGQ